MKKNAVVLALLIGMFGIVNANETANNKTISLETSRYGYMEPFEFTERGVVFYVFPNGEFDFNTQPQYRRTRRGNSHVNISYGAPRSYTHAGGIRIEHDHLGRIRRVGNVFMNYDRSGRIKRIGSVYMNYRYNLLRNIGGLHIYYNPHHRVIRTTGSIKPRIGCHFCGSHTCSINHYSGNDYYYHSDSDNNWQNDDDMYYYKNGKEKKKKK